MRRTVNDAVKFRGIGLHSGKPVVLTVAPAAADTGIVFHRSDAGPGARPVPARYDAVNVTHLRTGLTNDDGLPTNAIYGFATMLRKLLREQHPSAIGVAFDLPGPVFRNRMYSEYKANRPPTPEDLRPQMPYAKRVCEVLGITVLERSGFEADDLLASYAERAAADGADVVLVASDKDVLQLVGDRVKVFNPTKEIWLDASGVVEALASRRNRCWTCRG